MKFEDVILMARRYAELQTEANELQAEIIRVDTEIAQGKARALMGLPEGEKPADISAQRARLDELKTLLPHAQQILQHTTIQYRVQISARLESTLSERVTQWSAQQAAINGATVALQKQAADSAAAEAQNEKLRADIAAFNEETNPEMIEFRLHNMCEANGIKIAELEAEPAPK